jgi:RNA polymerase sigma-70 factor (ECF subfamily)
MVVSEVHAEEIVQEVFLKLWINRATLNPELSIKSYLFTITRNTTISFLKKAANNSKLREEIFYKSQKLANTTENYLREIELNSILQDALNRLPPRRRLIFEMSRNEGKSYREISKDLNISQNTVRNQLSMALETLRGYLLKNTEVAIILLLFSFGWM